MCGQCSDLGFQLCAEVLACLASVLLYLNHDLNDGLPEVSNLAIAIQEELVPEAQTSTWRTVLLANSFSVGQTLMKHERVNRYKQNENTGQLQ